MIRNWILIGVTAAATYLSRITGIEVMSRRKITPALRLYFDSVSLSIMSALIISQIISHDGYAQINLSLPALTGCFSAAFVMRKANHFLAAVSVGIIIGILTRSFLPD